MHFGFRSYVSLPHKSLFLALFLPRHQPSHGGWLILEGGIKKAGRYVGVPLRVVMYHLDVVLKLWRAGIVLGDDCGQGTRCLRL
ncbi:hypothetical protein M5D96_009558 [Drosophila gunungcola]|uniref:Uncharacterized protein n=1 Tax=Drosophila gunungcola TaxID=103775 RepID=A0A9P9YI89_9MUSC|nr:hypothetical protein M5D96_009558 [Drosophila gunungcola]